MADESVAQTRVRHPEPDSSVASLLQNDVRRVQNDKLSSISMRATGSDTEQKLKCYGAKANMRELTLRGEGVGACGALKCEEVRA
jgi:hypothetical protein